MGIKTQSASAISTLSCFRNLATIVTKMTFGRQETDTRFFTTHSLVCGVDSLPTKTSASESNIISRHDKNHTVYTSQNRVEKPVKTQVGCVYVGYCIHRA